MKYTNLITIILLAFAFAAIASQTDIKIAFAGPPGWTLPLAVFTEGAGSGGSTEKEPENPDPQAAEQKPMTENDIQAIAKKNADESVEHVEAGRSAPAIPATAANLGRFQNRANLSEEERKDLDPQESAEARQARERQEDTQRTQQENRQRDLTTKGERFGEVNPQEPPTGTGEGGEQPS